MAFGSPRESLQLGIKCPCYISYDSTLDWVPCPSWNRKVDKCPVGSPWVLKLMLARAGFSEETRVLATLAVAEVHLWGGCVLEAWLLA